MSTFETSNVCLIVINDNLCGLTSNNNSKCYIHTNHVLSHDQATSVMKRLIATRLDNMNYIKGIQLKVLNVIKLFDILFDNKWFIDDHPAFKTAFKEKLIELKDKHSDIADLNKYLVLFPELNDQTDINSSNNYDIDTSNNHDVDETITITI